MSIQLDYFHWIDDESEPTIKRYFGENYVEHIQSIGDSKFAFSYYNPNSFDSRGRHILRLRGDPRFDQPFGLEIHFDRKEIMATRPFVYVEEGKIRDLALNTTKPRFYREALSAIHSFITAAIGAMLEFEMRRDKTLSLESRLDEARAEIATLKERLRDARVGRARGEE